MRSSGILLHISSLPSAGGIGTLGREACRFVDFLRATGTRIWQMLPLGPTGYGDSPYQSFSTFAGNPYFIDPELLIGDGLLPPDTRLDASEDPSKVDFGWLYETRYALLKSAYEYAGKAMREQVDAFAAEHPWVSDYALFMALKGRFSGAPWTDWPADVRMRESEALARRRAELADEIAFQSFLQYLFFSQWERLRAYATKNNVLLMGDLPIYVAMDSADVWTAREAFQLDQTGRPSDVAGVPPDYFSVDGQLWGNPLYDWEALAKDRYGWWLRRMRAAAERFDIVRLDHFIGFANYYAVPADAKTARIGAWRDGPGLPLFQAIRSALPGLSIVAEDLGVLSEKVLALKAATGFPGMRVLDFAFGSDLTNDHLPHNIDRNCVYYTGTHDNDTIQGWWASADADERAFAAQYLKLSHGDDLNDRMIETVFASVADTAIVPMQDHLKLGREARMNEPSTLGGNWRWRMLPGDCSEALRARIAALNARYRRI